jgi:hypothetical protein
MIYVIFSTFFVESGALLCNHDGFLPSMLSGSVLMY